jgi:hypothetical protein
VTPSEQTIYSLTVPSAAESLTVLEGLCETFITESEVVAPDIALILRLSVAEACRNALTLSRVRERLNLTTLTFLRIAPGNDVTGIALEITDSGDGLAVDGVKPPYPPEMLGKRFVLAEPLDQQVIAKVEKPDRALLFSRALDTEASLLSREAMIAGAPERGLGLLALCRCWSLVSFRFDPDRGTTVRLEKPTLAI